MERSNQIKIAALIYRSERGWSTSIPGALRMAWLYLWATWRGDMVIIPVSTKEMEQEDGKV